MKFCGYSLPVSITFPKNIDKTQARTLRARPTQFHGLMLISAGKAIHTSIFRFVFHENIIIVG
jgi:hypothetical protein